MPLQTFKAGHESGEQYKLQPPLPGTIVLGTVTDIVTSSNIRDDDDTTSFTIYLNNTNSDVGDWDNVTYTVNTSDTDITVSRVEAVLQVVSGPDITTDAGTLGTGDGKTTQKLDYDPKVNQSTASFRIDKGAGRTELKVFEITFFQTRTPAVVVIT